jgi:hypothetical protein
MPSYDYANYVKKLLLDGPLLSSIITDSLVEKFKITKTYSRTVLSRLNDENIFNSYPLFFSSGQLGYSISQNRHEYVKLLDEKPRLKTAYEFLNRQRIVSKLSLLKITGALDTTGSKYYDIGKVLFDLKYFFPSLVEIEIDGSKFYSLQGSLGYDDLLQKQLYNVKIIPYVLSYCRKIGLISKKPHYLSEQNPFEGIETRQNLVFDATAFTSVGNPNKEKTICVFDISLSQYDSNLYKGFKYRIESLVHSTKQFNQRVIPIIVVEDIDFVLEKEILLENKTLLLKLSNIFGSRIKDFLNAIGLLDIDTMADAKTILNIVESSGHAKQLTRFFPFVFEQIINEIIHFLLRDAYTFNHGVKKKLLDGKYKEFDGWFENENEILVIESKYHRKNMIKWEEYDSKGKLNNDCVKYFFDNKYKFLQIWKMERKIKKNIKMVFVAANGFYKNVNEHSSEIPADCIHSILPSLMKAQDLIDICQSKGISIPDHKAWLKEYYIRKSNATQATEIEVINVDEIDDIFN